MDRLSLLADRVDLRGAVGLTAISCVVTMEIDFGAVVPLDYNSDGKREQMFVITASSATLRGDTITCTVTGRTAGNNSSRRKCSL